MVDHLADAKKVWLDWSEDSRYTKIQTVVPTHVELLVTKILLAFLASACYIFRIGAWLAWLHAYEERLKIVAYMQTITSNNQQVGL